MYEYTPTPNRLPGIAVALICAMAGILLFMPLKMNETVATLLRCAGLWLFLCGFLVAERFVLTSFTYSLEASGVNVDFVITEKRLRRTRTVCRVSSKQFTGLSRTGRGQPKVKLSRGTAKYNYCPDMFGTARYILLLDDDGPAAVRFTPDEKTVELIRALINGSE